MSIRILFCQYTGWKEVLRFYGSIFTICQSCRLYDLEYGSATIEMHKDSITPGQKVVIIDDLIATGGTTEAIIKLIEGLGGKVVKICFVMELAGLKGRALLKGYDVDSAIIYDGK